MDTLGKLYERALDNLKSGKATNMVPLFDNGPNFPEAEATPLEMLRASLERIVATVKLEFAEGICANAASAEYYAVRTYVPHTEAAYSLLKHKRMASVHLTPEARLIVDDTWGELLSWAKAEGFGIHIGGHGDPYGVREFLVLSPISLDGRF